MPLIEYEPGRVPGRDRADGRRVEPRVAGAAAGAARARRTSCSSCWTTPASGSSAATAARSRRRTSTRWRRTALRYNNMHTTALCSPRRSCILTGRNHHTNAMACITELAPAIPATTATSRSRTASCRRCCSQHGYNTYMVGKWHLIPEQSGDGRRAVRPLAAGARVRALLRVPRRRHQPVEPRTRLRQPSGRAARRRPRRATT